MGASRGTSVWLCALQTYKCNVKWKILDRERVYYIEVGVQGEGLDVIM